MHGKSTVAPDARGSAGSPSNPPPVVGKEFPDSAYTKALSRYPAVSLVLSMIIPILIVIIALGLRTEIAVRKENFTAEDTKAFRNMKAAETADAYWQSLLAASGQTMASRLDTSRTRHKPSYRVTIQFVLACRSGEQGCDNILTDDRVAFIKRVEDAATAPATGFQQVCWQNNFRNGAELPASPGCAPVNSLTQYVFPTQLAVPPFYYLDGQGATQQQINAAMRERMLVNPNIDWYTDSDFRRYGRTRVLRSQVILGTPLSSRFSESQTRSHIDAYVQKMYDAVREAAAENEQIAVSIGGDRVVESRVIAAMESEAWKAPVAAIIIAVVLFVHCRSIVVSALGLLQILFTYLVTASIFAMNRDGELPLLSFVSLFFTIVWCVDGVLVVYDNFIYSGVMATSGRRNTLRVSQRMAFVMRKSIKGILVAHACALIAFSINTLSPVSELREFAVLMIVMMLVSAYFFVFFTPAAVLFHHFYFSRRRRTLQRQKEIMLRDGVVERNPAVAALIEELEGLKSITGQTAYADIAKTAEDRRAGNKERRSDLMNKTNSLAASSFFTEWVVAFRRMDEAAVVRRLREKEAAEEEEAAREAAAFGGTPERQPRRRGSDAHSDKSDRSPVGDGGEDAAPVMRIESRNFQAAEQQATLDDFADVDEAPEGAEDAKAVPAYRSMRHIPTAAVTHIPAELLFRNPENVDFARRLVTARLAGGEPEPARQAPQQDNRAEDGHDDDDIEEMMLDDNGQVVRADEARMRAPAAINMPVLRERELHDEDDEPYQRDPLMRLEEKVQPFDQAWSSIADELQVLPGDSPLAELKGILAYRTVAALVGPCLNDDNVVTRFDSAQQIGARIARVGLLDADGRTQTLADAGAAPDVEEQLHEVGCGPCAKMTTVRRRWCCGRWGRRVDETPEERDARIMKKKVKHEGYGRAERFFYNGYATGLHRLRRLVALLFLVVLALAIWGVTRLKAVDARVQLLADSDNEETFGVHEELFSIPADSPCDFCGGAYRNVAEYRPPTESSVSICNAAGFGTLALNSLLDQCNVCFGTNACLDCLGVPNGGHTQDSCGQCLPFNDSARDQCHTCQNDPTRRTPDCQYCAQTRGIQGGGPNCQVLCNTSVCPPDRGTCNRFTGRCDCHASRELGFFSTAPGDIVQCSRCVTSVGPAPDGANSAVACKKDCVFASDVSDACGTCSLAGVCMGCPNGTVGGGCTIQDPSVCLHGTLDTQTQMCTCHAGFAGPRCAGSTLCNGRGLWISSSEGVLETCDCRGAWTGKFCNYCRCRNGGTCNEEGECQCPPGWSGPTCSSCSPACSAHGTCPTPMRTSQYDPLQCLGAFCPFDDLYNDRVCSECRRAEVGPCVAYEPPFNTEPNRDILCASDTKCFWNTTAAACVQRRNLSDPVATTQMECSLCRGFWEGAGCDVCAQPAGTNGCNAAGAVTACDGRTYLPGDQIPVVDLCGVCGGSNHCVGCDGVIAVNGQPRVIDRCGVCGGDGVCSDESSPFEITIVLGVVPSYLDHAHTVEYGTRTMIDPHEYMDPGVQDRIDRICGQIHYKTTGPNTRAQLVSCPMSALREYVLDPDNNARLNRTGGAVGFPITEGSHTYRNQVFFRFLQQTSRLSEVGFTSAYPDAADFAPVYMKIKVRALAEHNGDASRLLFLARRFDLLAESISTNAAVFTMQVSQRWIEALTELQSRSGMAWASGIGFAAFLMLVHILTCSATATVIAGLAVGFTCIVSLAFFAAFDFRLGAVEQIGVSLLLGLAAEHTIHFVDTYLDTVQGSTSQLFGRDVSRLAAMRVAMAQSATPILASACATVVVACMYLPSAVQPFRRASEITVIVVLVSLLTSLVVVGAFLVMAGPTATFRIITVALVIAMHWMAIWGIVVFALWLAQARAPDGSVAVS